MDYMRISDNEPSSVIVDQTMKFKKGLKAMTQKFRNKLKPKGMV